MLKVLKSQKFITKEKISDRRHLKFENRVCYTKKNIQLNKFIDFRVKLIGFIEKSKIFLQQFHQLNDVR